MEVDMENPLDCNICNAILKEPVILPCGHTICKLHEIDRRVKSEQETHSLHCRICNLSHSIPMNGFPSNRAIETLLHRKLQSIDLGDEHAKALKYCKEFENALNKIRQAKQDPEMEIHSIIADLKNKIDLNREERKKKIDDEAQLLIDELDELERTCKANNSILENIKSSSDLKSLLIDFENDNANMKKELSFYVRNEEGWKAIVHVCSLKLKHLLTEYEEMKERFFQNRLFDCELKQTKYCQNAVNYLL